MLLSFRRVTLDAAVPFVISRTWRARRLPPLWKRLRRSPVVWELARRLGSRATSFSVLEVQLQADGWSGFGEAAPSRRHGESLASAAAFLETARPRLADLPPDPEALRQRLTQLPPGQLAARAGLDAALHDLAGKLGGQPVWRLLGLEPAGPATSYTLSLDEPAAMAAAARRASRLFRRLKLKLGGQDGQDAERVSTVRAATSLPLSVDANEGWTLDQALALLPRLAALGVDLVEQPLPAGDPAGSRLKALSPLPIYLDEDCTVLADLPRCATAGHGVNLKLAKCGGIGETIRLARAARDLGLGLMIGCQGESSLGLAAAAQIASLFDYADLDANLLLARDPWQGLALVDGVQLPADAPGLGVWPRSAT
jgi:L-alanine-DL-glutamate epimerase-like enolase superfamily enzyme